MNNIKVNRSEVKMGNKPKHLYKKYKEKLYCINSKVLIPKVTKKYKFF